MNIGSIAGKLIGGITGLVGNGGSAIGDGQELQKQLQEQNLKMLELQAGIQNDSLWTKTISDALKASHDAKMGAANNFK